MKKAFAVLFFAVLIGTPSLGAQAKERADDYCKYTLPYIAYQTTSSRDNGVSRADFLSDHELDKVSNAERSWYVESAKLAYSNPKMSTAQLARRLIARCNRIK